MRQFDTEKQDPAVRSRKDISLFVSDQMDALLAYWDRDLICRFANNGYSKFFGLTGKQMEGIILRELLGPLYEQSLPYIRGVLRGQKQVFEREFTTLENEKIQTVTQYFPDIINGEVVGFCVYVTDITELKNKEKALQSSEEKFRHIIENAPDAIVIANTDGTIQFINSRSEQMFGYNRAELIGKPMETIMSGNKGLSHIQALFSINYAQAEPVKSIELSGLCKNGKSFPADVNLITLTSPGEVLFLASFRDITWKVEKENEILRTKNNQAALINATKDHIWSVDREYKLVSANDAYFKLVKEYTGRDAYEGYYTLTATPSGEENAYWKMLLDRGLQGENFMIESTTWSNFEITFSPIYQHASSEIIGVACFARNVAQRNEVRREKLEAEQRFTAMFQHGSDLIGIIDNEAYFKYLSPSIARHFGYELSALIGTSPLDFVHPEDLEKFSHLFWQVLNEPETSLPAIRVRHADGHYRWVEAIASNLLNDAAVKGIVLNARDVTERKERETEKENIIKELTKSNNNLKQFSFITSHNLRAPLSNITGLLKIIEHAKLDQDNSLLIELIEKSTEQLTTTINDITKIVVINNNVNTPVCSLNITEAFEQVNKIFINTENDIAAELICDFQVSEVWFNQTYLESIFTNLISNSIKYRRNNCTLKIEVRTFLNDANEIVLTFADNGMGIDLNRHKERLFGMYQRFHSHTDGQGLGLYIMKSQIEALGGSINVASELNKGTTFTIVFPKG
jgi:PAS domain S-box-containing protein